MLVQKIYFITFSIFLQVVLCKCLFSRLNVKKIRKSRMIKKSEKPPQNKTGTRTRKSDSMEK